MESGRHRAGTAVRRATVLGGLVLLGLALVAGACRESLGTSIYVTVDFPSELEMEQLRVWGSVADSGIGPYLVPEEPARVISNGDTFRVLVPNAPDQAEAKLNVQGLHEGEQVAFGTGQAPIEEGNEVSLTVRLELPSVPDGGTGNGGTPDGGASDGGFCANCASGCCRGSVCTTSTFNTCGSGGVACVACTPQLADSCAAAGYCACGRGAACSPTTADRCQFGFCLCGSSGACMGNQRCMAGKCK